MRFQDGKGPWSVVSLPESARDLVLRHALQNAHEHGGRADPKAVLGRVLGSNPDLRPWARELRPLVEEIIREVQSLSPEEIERRVGAPRPLESPEPSQGSLPPLPGAKEGEVVLRFAPNPSGPLTLGHARGVVLTFEYRSRYRGKALLRFDDTDSTVKRPMVEAYGWIEEDVEWLSASRADKVFRASARIPLYYRWARELIEKGGAYVCTCSGEEFRRYKESSTPCPDRSLPKEEHLERWERMTAGGYQPQEAVLRVRTEISHPDPALRDWVAFRIPREPHPLEGTKYPAWPLLDFQSAIDDHVEGVTHIIRGKDLRDSTEKQSFLYAHLGWTYPPTLYWGRVSVHEFGKFSKSTLSEAIRKGEYSGWDDPRLPTLRALRRRGFVPEAIRAFWISFGLSEKDVAASLRTLESENRRIVDPIAHRYFFVEDPIEITLETRHRLESRAPLHPDRPSEGSRIVQLVPDDGVVRVFLSSRDVSSLSVGSTLRLKDLTNAFVYEETKWRETGNDLSLLRQGIPIFQWVAPPGIPTHVLMDDGSVRQGLCEEAVLDEKEGSIVQFERFGFVRLERVRREGVEACFTHR